MEELKTRIAKRAARELNDGDVVNLGIGLPTMVAKNLPEGISIILQSENGIMGMGEKKDETDPNIVNAGAQPVSILPGGQFFDSATSFALIRGGHVDATILGALQVDVHGNLSNWIIPGKMVPGMGGAMDLVTGAKKSDCSNAAYAKRSSKNSERVYAPVYCAALCGHDYHRNGSYEGNGKRDCSG